VNKINGNFLKQHAVTDEVAELLYSDPYYGLGPITAEGTYNTYSNYIHWDNLLPVNKTEDALSAQA